MIKTTMTDKQVEKRMIVFEAEVLEVRAKKDGMDKMYRIVLETNQEECLKLQEWIAKDTVKVEVK